MRYPNSNLNTETALKAIQLIGFARIALPDSEIVALRRAWDCCSVAIFTVS